jgi:hypothetical protein
MDDHVVILQTECGRISLYDLRVGNFVGGFWRRKGVLNVSKFDKDSGKLCYHLYSKDGFCASEGWEFQNKRIGDINKGRLKPTKTKGRVLSFMDDSRQKSI